MAVVSSFTKDRPHNVHCSSCSCMNINSSFDNFGHMVNSYYIISLIDHPASRIEHRTSSIKNRASITEHRASIIEPRASSIQHRASSISPNASFSTPISSLLSSVSARTLVHIHPYSCILNRKLRPTDNLPHITSQMLYPGSVLVL